VPSLCLRPMPDARLRHCRPREINGQHSCPQRGLLQPQFEVFAVDGPAKPHAQDQRPDRWDRHAAASGANGTSFIDREYDVATIPDVPAALQSAGAWLRARSA
jgi:hypothetical protein